MSEVFEDLLRGAAQFAVDRVFSTLDLKAKVLGGRRQRPPFPSGSAHMEGRVEDFGRSCSPTIVFHHRSHAENQTVMTLDHAITRFAAFAAESSYFLELDSTRASARVGGGLSQASTPGASRSRGQLGRYRVRKQLTSRSKGVLEFHAVDEPPARAEVRLREFELESALPAQELDAHLDRLAREMTVLRKIRHPYVACITGHFQTGCSWVEVSDWFDGEPLENIWPLLRDASVLEKAGVFLKVVGALGLAMNVACFTGTFRRSPYLSVQTLVTFGWATSISRADLRCHIDLDRRIARHERCAVGAAGGAPRGAGGECQAGRRVPGRSSSLSAL